MQCELLSRVNPWLPWQRWQSVWRESDALETGCHLAWALGSRTYLRLWHDLEIVGRENLPVRPPFIMVANHASHLDAVVLAAALPLGLRDQVFPLAAGDVFFAKPWRAAFAAMMVNALPLWRRKSTPKALAELRRRLLAEPCGYILFPEGGRTRDGRLTRFKSGIGMMVAGTEVPVVPCHLEGTFEACPAGQVLPRQQKIVMRIGAPLQFRDVADERAGWDVVANQLQEAVEKLGQRKGLSPFSVN